MYRGGHPGNRTVNAPPLQPEETKVATDGSDEAARNSLPRRKFLRLELHGTGLNLFLERLNDRKYTALYKQYGQRDVERPKTIRALDVPKRQNG
ncbi:hypothetical protein NQ318_015955 [Aromia moschata]|uniref:Uncharacterized protein n=1 Tax=Aromia moschata TaxID=1265417 RepID=A0AAV8X911_9CUCU|nr:hypothetical protein NQ318_015955 [Aromia moschata]